MECLNRLKDLIDKLRINHNLNDEDLLYILDNIDQNFDMKNYLFKNAREVKEKYYGNRVYMRGLIEISNYCKQNCLYCGIRRDNKKVDRYRLDIETIIECVEEGYKLGYRTFVLQGGEDAYYSDNLLIELIKFVKTNYRDCAITLSLGERGHNSFKKLFDAGADRYLLRHETACMGLYNKLHPGMSFENRKNSLKDLKEIGYQVGAGFMVGLPEQTNKSLVEDLKFLKKLEPHMVGIGPFIPHPETPIGHENGGTVEKTLVLLALTRLLLPTVLLPSTTALGTLDKQGREKALKSGANVVMPNLSPTNVREKYELYKDKICTGDEAAHCRKCIERRINSVGYIVDMHKGDHYSLDERSEEEKDIDKFNIVNLK